MVPRFFKWVKAINKNCNHHHQLQPPSPGSLKTLWSECPTNRLHLILTGFPAVAPELCDKPRVFVPCARVSLVHRVLPVDSNVNTISGWSEMVTGKLGCLCRSTRSCQSRAVVKSPPGELGWFTLCPALMKVVDCFGTTWVLTILDH